MRLLTRWIDQHRGWKSTSLENEKDYILAFYPDLEEVKKRLRDREIIACSIKLYKLDESIV